MCDDFYYNDGYIESLNEEIDSLQQDYYDLKRQHEDELEELELRVLKNFIYRMPSAYRAKNVNWVVVRDILMSGVEDVSVKSCVQKCKDLDIPPYGYIIGG